MYIAFEVFPSGSIQATLEHFFLNIHAKYFA